MLVDIDSNDGTSTVVLTDGTGARRTYSVPSDWTGDFTNDGPPGWMLLDLSVTNDQPGFGSTATAVEEAGFDHTGVTSIDIHLAGSGGVDNLSWCETGGALSQPAFALPRNGSGVNGISLTNTSLPRVGGTWAADLDCRPFGTGLATLALRQRAIPGTMTAFGERLIDGPLFLEARQAFAGVTSPFTWSIPLDPALIGVDLHVQGSCWSGQTMQVPKALRARNLSNALDLVLGL